MSRQLTDGSVERHVAFIPSEKAKLGKILDLDFDGETRKGFRVDEVWGIVTVDDVDRWRESHKRFQWVLGD